jgi:hypothetical protein
MNIHHRFILEITFAKVFFFDFANTPQVGLFHILEKTPICGVLFI